MNARPILLSIGLLGKLGKKRRMGEMDRECSLSTNAICKLPRQNMATFKIDDADQARWESKQQPLRQVSNYGRVTIVKRAGDTKHVRSGVLGCI